MAHPKHENNKFRLNPVSAEQVSKKKSTQPRFYEPRRAWNQERLEALPIALRKLTLSFPDESVPSPGSDVLRNSVIGHPPIKIILSNFDIGNTLDTPIILTEPTRGTSHPSKEWPCSVIGTLWNTSTSLPNTNKPNSGPCPEGAKLRLYDNCGLNERLLWVGGW